MIFDKPFHIFYVMSEETSGGNDEENQDEVQEPSTLDKLVAYVMNTPGNTNPAILIQLVRDVYNDDSIRDILNPTNNTSGMLGPDQGIIKT